MTKPDTKTIEQEGSEPLTTILASAEAAAQVEHASQSLTREVTTFSYDTETTEVARTFVNQIDRLTRLIVEDDEEIEFVEKERDRQMHELQLRFEREQDDIMNNARQGVEIAGARRKDRFNARAAVQKVVDELKGNGQ